MAKEVRATYVTGLATYGFLNGIINVAFTTARWMPRPIETEDGIETKILTEIEVTADLRMDLLLAQQLHQALGAMIDEHTKPMPKASN